MILCCMAVCSHPVEALVTQVAGPLMACGADEKYGGMVRSRVWGSGFRASSKRVEVPNVPGERSLLQEGWRQCATEEHELFETCEKVLTSRLCGFGKPCPNSVSATPSGDSGPLSVLHAFNPNTLKDAAGLESAKEVDKLVRLLRVLRRRFIEHGLEGRGIPPFLVGRN